MNLKTNLVRTVASAAIAGASLTMAVGPASAGTGALSRPGASMTYDNHTLLAYTSWTVKDTDGGDKSCARAYVSIGGDWFYQGQACGSGATKSGTQWGSADRVKVCNGVPTKSESNCVSQKAA